MGGPAQGQSCDTAPQLSVTVDRSVNSGWSGDGRERSRGGMCALRGCGGRAGIWPTIPGAWGTTLPKHQLVPIPSCLCSPPPPQSYLPPQFWGLALLRDSLEDAGFGFPKGMDTDKQTDSEQYWPLELQSGRRDLSSCWALKMWSGSIPCSIRGISQPQLRSLPGRCHLSRWRWLCRMTEAMRRQEGTWDSSRK